MLTTDAGATIEIALQPETAYHGQSSASATDVKPGQEVRIDVSGGFGGGGLRGGVPDASGNPAPNGSPVPGGGRGLGPAQDVTILTP